jgi:hypothetical protein
MKGMRCLPESALQEMLGNMITAEGHESRSRPRVARQKSCCPAEFGTTLTFLASSCSRGLERGPREPSPEQRPGCST